MPYLKTHVIRGWLVEHNLDVQAVGRGMHCAQWRHLPGRTLSNVVRGHDPMRPGRINVICKVTVRYGDGIPYRNLVAEEVRRAD